MFTDMTETELQSYRSTQTLPEDFSEFWESTLVESRALGDDVSVSKVESPLTTIDVYDVTFPGFGGDPIRAWLRVPAGATGPLPTVVQFVGYGGGRGRPWAELFWASAGFAHFHMDTRGQGGNWSVGDTPDNGGSGGPQFAGVMTRGILNREDYYYRRLITDAVRAVDAAAGLSLVDSSRIAVRGNSQGGALAIAASALSSHVRAAAAGVPFLADFPRATVVTNALPFREIGEFLKVHREKVAQVHDTLRYFDTVNFARNSSTPTYYSAALMDAVTPPSTVFGAFHEHHGPKSMTVWPYNGHEAGDVDEEPLILDFLRRELDL
jgi:cephalosporin-C deacetylase